MLKGIILNRPHTSVGRNGQLNISAMAMDRAFRNVAIRKTTVGSLEVLRELAHFDLIHLALRRGRFILRRGNLLKFGSPHTRI